MNEAQMRGPRPEALEFIHAMLGQLRKMADEEGCDMLAYLIEMAHVEANDIIREQRPARLRDPSGNARRRYPG